jgi:hypothetical protein
LNGTGGTGATLIANSNGPLVVDGNTVTVGSRLLVKNESNAITNGVYTVTAVGDGASPYQLLRATDFDTGSEIPSGFVFVIDGAVNNSSGWTCTNPETPTPIIGVDPIVFNQFSYAGGYTAGNALTLTGTQFSVNADPETTWINGSNQLGVKPNANLTTPNIGNASFQSLTVLATLLLTTLMLVVLLL